MSYCIDAAQTVGSIDVDIKKIGCGFMAFSEFKWLCISLQEYFIVVKMEKFQFHNLLVENGDIVIRNLLPALNLPKDSNCIS